MQAIQTYLISYKTAQKMSCFVAGQISLNQLPELLSVGSRPTSVWGDMGAQILLDF
jgi:hypothetical protein